MMASEGTSSIKSLLLPLGLAAAVSYMSGGNSNQAAATTPQNFNFVSQPSSSIMSKVLSMFGSSTSELSSPDIPRSNLSPDTTFQPFQPASLPAGTASPAVNALSALLGLSNNGPAASNVQSFPVLNRRSTPPGNLPPLDEARFQIPNADTNHVPVINPAPNVPSVSPIVNSLANSFAELQGEQGLLQTSSETEINNIRDASAITTGLRSVDGGLSMMIEHTANAMGYRSPLEGIPLDGMTQSMLQNIGDLVHYKRKLEPIPRSRDDVFVPHIDGHPSIAELPVTHNVFDNDVPEELQRAMDSVSDGTFKLPPIAGVPFHANLGFNN